MSSSTKESMDLGSSSRRRPSVPKAGSVWESRMKIDEVQGGIKVFNTTLDLTSHQITQNPANNSEIEVDNKAPKQSPAGKRKTWKSEGLEGSPVKIAALRSELSKGLDESSSVLSDVIKRSPIPMKKTRSGLPNQSQKSEIRLGKVKSDFTAVDDDGKSELKSESCNGNRKNSVPFRSVKAKSGARNEKIENWDEGCRDLDVCEDKAVTSNVGGFRAQSDEVDFSDGESETDLDGEEEDDEKFKSHDIKEVTAQDHRANKKPVHHSPAVNHARFHPTPTKINSISENSHGVPRSSSKLQSFVDLVMWRDVSKSAFVFGIGTFAIISSSFTRDLNISFISVISYLGLLYLAAIFLFRSLITRGSMELGSANGGCLIGEEEAMWAVKLLVPYVNEFLLKLRALFSGDPATTMKLAVLLFILARCGSSITIWKMAKLGFIGVFTVPKICSSYSSHLTAYGTFWMRRFRDGWESCSHKKAVGFAIFTLIWNFSSLVARIWAVFMLFAAFKYYQQSVVKDGWEEETSSNRSWQRQSTGGQQIGQTRKQKKVN